MAVLIISDLHLSGERPAILELFQAFVAGEAARAEALYILGDLFEAWLGDDAVTPDSQPVIDSLKSLTANGVPVYVMRGNRDFLLGERFARLTGCHLLADEHVIDLYGSPTLLLHGDTLCTDDVEYQQVRAMVRSPAWQQAFLAKSIDERIRFAREARAKSREVTQNKAEDIMDVNQQSVSAALQGHGVTRLIHGHTHRPAVHRHDLHGKAATRIVLGDWYSQSSVLRVDERGFELSGNPQHNWF